MTQRRITIGRCMAWIAICALNAGLVRAFLVQEMFCGAILLLFALQAGVWCLPRSHGRARRFWLGFEVSGLLVIAALLLCELVPDSLPNRLLNTYIGAVMNLAFSHLSDAGAEFFDLHLELFLTVIYFVPELAVSVAGGMIAMFVARAGGSFVYQARNDEPASLLGEPEESSRLNSRYRLRRIYRPGASAC